MRGYVYGPHGLEINEFYVERHRDYLLHLFAPGTKWPFGEWTLVLRSPEERGALALDEAGVSMGGS